MKFAEDNKIQNSFIKKLLSCDLCWGFWVYGLVSFIMGEVLFRDYYYFPIFSEVVTGGISSFIVHMFVSGWKNTFEVLIIE